MKVRTSALPQQLRILLLLELIDDRDVLVGDLLHVLEAAPFVVLGDLVVLQQLLEPIVRVAARPGGRRCGLLRRTCARASTFPCGAPRSATGAGCGSTLPSVAGLRPRLALRIAFSMVASQRRVERLRHDHRRFGNRERRDLIERHLRAVGFDVHRVEDRRPRRAPSARRRARAGRARSDRPSASSARQTVL